jgi:hypothetical protein
MDNITDTNTDTDGQVTAHNSTDNNEPTIIELETETMVIELSCVNEAGIPMTPSCRNPRKRALSGSYFPPVDSSESFSEMQILTSNGHERGRYLANRCKPIP